MATNIALPALHLNPPPQQESPLDQFQRLMQLKNEQTLMPLRQQAMQQQVQSGQLGIQQQQQALKDQQGIADWYKNLDPTDPNAFDPSKVGKALAASGVSGSGILNVQGKILENRKNVLAMDKDQIANQQEKANNLYSGINGIIGETDPNRRAQAITSLIQTAAQNGSIPPQQAQQMLSNAGAITDDQLKQFQHGLGVSAAFLGSIAREQTAQTAQQKLGAQMNPQSSLYEPSAASVALGTAPGASQIQANAVSQAAKKAGAEAAARQPYEMALARQRQALSQGDPSMAGQLLVNGDATLSELKARGATPDFIARTLFAAKQMSGGKYNAQQAEAQFDVAKSPAQVQFFGSAKSLTDPGGTLDQLAKAAEKIPQNQFPVFNKIEDWTREAAGSGPLAEYAARVLGVADDYSKVMGGGTGSDASRLAAANLVAAKLSKEGREGALAGIRGSVNSQIAGRIGDNPILKRMYGSQLPSASGAPSGGNSGPLKITLGSGKQITIE